MLAKLQVEKELVIIPGDMGRVSYVLVGTERAMKETFGSTCHGAGRVQSRAAAKRHLSGREVSRALEARGIMVRASILSGVAEEASGAYKDATQVVGVTHIPASPESLPEQNLLR